LRRSSHGLGIFVPDLRTHWETVRFIFSFLYLWVLYCSPVSPLAPRRRRTSGDCGRRPLKKVSASPSSLMLFPLKGTSVFPVEMVPGQTELPPFLIWNGDFRLFLSAPHPRNSPPVLSSNRPSRFLFSEWWLEPQVMISWPPLDFPLSRPPLPLPPPLPPPLTLIFRPFSIKCKLISPACASGKTFW